MCAAPRPIASPTTRARGAPLTQVLIGLGLVYHPTVKPTLALSFAWTLIVWWFAEAFGMLFMMMATPLTGAPGAVLLYGIVGLALWPTPRPGGLLGVRGVRTAWAALWIVMAWLWLEPQSSARLKARPGPASPAVHFRVRSDRVDSNGKVTLRYGSRLHHIGLGRAHKGKAIRLLIADRQIRVVDREGELIRELTLDPERDYQPLARG